MIKFWKEHTTLRIVLLAISFFAGMILIYFGWKTMPSTLAGLGVMGVGLAFLLAALWLYNKPYQDPPKARSPKMKK